MFRFFLLRHTRARMRRWMIGLLSLERWQTLDAQIWLRARTRLVIQADVEPRDEAIQ